MTPQLLFKKYQKCSSLEQQIIQVMAVIYSCNNRSKIISCLNQLGITTVTGLPFDENRLRPQMTTLVDQGLAVFRHSQGTRCNPLVAELICREILENKTFSRIVEVVEKNFVPKKNTKTGRYQFFDLDELLQVVRIAFYQGNSTAIQAYIKDYNEQPRNRYEPYEPISLGGVITLIMTNLQDLQFVETNMPEISEVIIVERLETADFDLDPVTEDLAILETRYEKTGQLQDQTKLILVEQYLLRGDIKKADLMLKEVNSAVDHQLALAGWLSFVTGNVEQSIDYYHQAFSALKKRVGKRKNVYFSELKGLFFLLALLQEGSASSLSLAASLSEVMQAQSGWLREAYFTLFHLINIQQGKLASREAFNNFSFFEQDAPIKQLFILFALMNGDRPAIKKNQVIIARILKSIYLTAEKNGYRWVASVAADLLAQAFAEVDEKLADNYQRAAANLRGDQWVSWHEIIQPKETWELSLKALANLQNPASVEGAVPIADKRLVWFISVSSGNWFELEPKEQKRKANGDWSKGRAIAMRRLADELHSFDYLTPQDRQICSHIEVHREYNYYGNDTTYDWAIGALLALVDHPLVFWVDSQIRVEVMKGEIQLRVKELSATQLALSLDPPVTLRRDDPHVMIIKETPTRLRLYQITVDHIQIATIIGKENQLTVPTKAKEQVLAAINGVANLLTIHSDIGGGDINAREVEAQSTPHVHLFPMGEGLKVSILVCPFGEQGPYYHPAKGGELIIAEVAGERLKTQRDFENEAGLAFDVLQECSLLLDCPREEGEFFVDDPEQCLELLAALREMGTKQAEMGGDRLVVEWPQGEKFRITHYGGASNFHVNIRQERDWFALEGELRLSDDLVLDMQNLLHLLEKTPGRFIQLDEGKFIALTHEFRRRLDDIRAFSDQQGKQTKIHPLAAFALGDFTDEMQVNADQHWQKHIEKIRSFEDIQPQIPSTLQAELRDYQVDGFNWLMRLANWQMGACLADDMGLGKTLQALTTILARATQGASLVIAPTSVCMNWISEAATFAPTLNVIVFGGGDRQETLDNVQPFDLVVCSYGLLQQEDVGKMLAEVQWKTIVLDEAQAIKNSATKRSQAAMNLQGEFKIITTGTPIENHLGELWNLFRFINPGLLGSQKSFNERFANAIERNQDKETKQRLKRLIQPFILRRTKTQVLTELPSRTEITLTVELSSEEMAMYEALRREAIAKLTESTAEHGAKHLQVLAEIMKLRRMCCNPSLVMPDTPLTGSKLQLFGEVLGELLENNHKALVFSQFVDHLSILRNYLDKQKITYQYLDGSTPTPKRKQAVDAFQAGEGNVFLISLKAGGTGLNLTAADYVIHMDPWWNPAVEDQASDRAHRMGQQRPVTIYRLVARNTIEEKIVALHQHKRDLASSLLEGTDAGGKMSTDDLINLIREV